MRQSGFFYIYRIGLLDGSGCASACFRIFCIDQTRPVSAVCKARRRKSVRFRRNQKLLRDACEIRAWMCVHVCNSFWIFMMSKLGTTVMVVSSEVEGRNIIWRSKKRQRCCLFIIVIETTLKYKIRLRNKQKTISRIVSNAQIRKVI